jgi:undecaprenyl-diphosphatase
MFSRVFIGTHYVSDVLGGMGTGLAAALAVNKFNVKGSRLDRILTNIL